MNHVAAIGRAARDATLDKRQRLRKQFARRILKVVAIYLHRANQDAVSLHYGDALLARTLRSLCGIDMRSARGWLFKSEDYDVRENIPVVIWPRVFVRGLRFVRVGQAKPAARSP